ncbi:MAG TPA: CDP-diacylglycerol--serine O-phosphatidyltransferase [candidate division Zixibacteria bacterium]|nr:CDP-diacylglycerol--serine O-phosphatidyltransferase [candidate division Zixibacteria bacterium]
MAKHNYRGILPGSFTMGSVVCGFLAILSAFEGELITACWLVILAGFLDGLDGKIARLSGATSRFGIELDSLADFLSFGVAPAVIIYVAKLQMLGKWGWLIGVVYIMAASYRLARYNLLATTEEKMDFVGLPVPAAAMPLVTYLIFSDYLWGQINYGQYLVSMIILLSALMVSQVPYDSMPDRFNTVKNRIKIAIIIIAAIAVLINPQLLLFPFFAAYIIFGLVRGAYKYLYLGVGMVKKRRQFRDRKVKKTESLDEQ